MCSSPIARAEAVGSEGAGLGPAPTAASAGLWAAWQQVRRPGGSRLAQLRLPLRPDLGKPPGRQEPAPGSRRGRVSLQRGCHEGPVFPLTPGPADQPDVPVTRISLPAVLSPRSCSVLGPGTAFEEGGVQGTGRGAPRTSHHLCCPAARSPLHPAASLPGPPWPSPGTLHPAPGAPFSTLPSVPLPRKPKVILRNIRLLGTCKTHGPRACMTHSAKRQAGPWQGRALPLPPPLCAPRPQPWAGPGARYQLRTE